MHIVKAKSILIILALVSTSTLVGLISFAPLVNAEIEFTPNPVIVTGNSDTKEGLGICSDDNGPIYVTWSQKMDDGFTDVLLSYSSNNGTSFSPAITVNDNTEGSQTSPESGVTDDGNLLIAWQDSYADGGDIVIGRSEDRGMTFTEMHVSNHDEGTQSNPSMDLNGDKVAVAWEEYRSDPTIRIWWGNNGTLAREIEGHAEAVMDVEYSPDGTMLASASEDNTVKLWDSSDGDFIRNVTTYENYATAVNWSADGTILAAGSHDFNITLFNTTDWSIITQFNSTDGTPTQNYVNAISFSPNGTYLAAAYNGRYGTSTPTGLPSQHYNVTVWNMADNTSWTSTHSNSVYDIAFSHNGTYVASGGKDSNLRIWDSVTGASFKAINIGYFVNSLSWSPDDTHISVGLGNNSIALVNISDTTDISWLSSQHTGRVNSIDWHPIRYIASGASDPNAKIWDEATGLERDELPGHQNSVQSVDWSTDGTNLVTAGGISNQYGMGENQIYCAVSSDGGLSFELPILVSDSFSRNRLRPDIGVDASGNISLVWYDYRSGQEDIYFVNSTDGGDSFGKNKGIATKTTSESTPEIFVEDDGTAHVVWQYGTGSGVRYANSSNNFSIAQTIAIDAQAPSVAGSPDGSTIWVTYRNQSTDNNYHLMSHVSYDGGLNFADIVDLNFSAALQSHIYDVYVDKFNQTSFTWMISNNIFFKTTTLTDDWAPYIMSSDPLDGATDVSIFTDFTITFSEPMDKVSVEVAFSWTDGTNTWYVGDCTNNQGDWNAYGNKVSFTPDQNIEPSVIPRYSTSSYSFSIEATATDLAGNSLATAYTVTFTTSADVDPPRIEHSPSQITVSYDMEYTVMAIVTDQWGTVDQVRLFYQGVGDLSPTNSIIMAITDSDSDSYSATIMAQQSIGQMYYYIEAEDEFSNVARLPDDYTNQSQLFNVSVVDGVKPEISHVQMTEQEVFFSIDIWAVITDEISMDSVELNYRSVGGSFTNVTMNQTTNGSANTYNYTIPAQTEIGSLHYNITAKDSSENYNATTFYTIEIVDRSSPVISTPEPVYRANETEVLVRANVTDNIEVDTVVLYFKSVSGNQWVPRTMQHVDGDIYEFTIPAQRNSGTIYFYVNATDSSGNSASTLTEQDQFQIEVVGVGTDYTIYYILGVILAALMILLVYLVIKKFSEPDREEEVMDEPETVVDRPSESGPEEIVQGDEPAEKVVEE